MNIALKPIAEIEEGKIIGFLKEHYQYKKKDYIFKDDLVNDLVLKFNILEDKQMRIIIGKMAEC